MAGALPPPDTGRVGIAIDRVMDMVGLRQPWLAALVACVAILGLPALVVTKLLDAPPFGRTYVKLLSCIVLLLACGCWALLHFESKAFRDDWAQQAPPGAGRPGGWAWTATSSALNGQIPNSFAGSCAFDDGLGSAWLSDRSQGPGEMVVVAYKQPVVVSQVHLIPGWFSTGATYAATAKPQAIEIFSDTGAVRDWALPETSFSSDPSPVVLNLLEHSAGPLYGTAFYLRVLRIEGDVRAHSAITEITLTANAAPASDDRPVISARSVRPRLTKSGACTSTNWAFGGN